MPQGVPQGVPQKLESDRVASTRSFSSVKDRQRPGQFADCPGFDFSGLGFQFVGKIITRKSRLNSFRLHENSFLDL